MDSFLERLTFLIQNPGWKNENANSIPFPISRDGSRVAVAAEAAQVMQVALDGLDTIGPLKFLDEKLGPMLLRSEPWVDPITQEWFMCGLTLRDPLFPEYIVFSCEPGASDQKGTGIRYREVARFPAKHISPIHSISLSSRHIVVIQKSQTVDVASVFGEEAKWLVTGEYGRINPFPWQPDRPTIIHLIDRETGERVEFETDPTMFFFTW